MSKMLFSGALFSSILVKEVWVFFLSCKPLTRHWGKNVFYMVCGAYASEVLGGWCEEEM